MESTPVYVFYQIDEYDRIWFLEYAELEEGVFQGSSNCIDNMVYHSINPWTPVNGFEPIELSLAQVMLF